MFEVLDGIGMWIIRPSGNTGLGALPSVESNPFRLKINFMVV
jgi:hypothetical protein